MWEWPAVNFLSDAIIRMRRGVGLCFLMLAGSWSQTQRQMTVMESIFPWMLPNHPDEIFRNFFDESMQSSKCCLPDTFRR